MSDTIEMFDFCYDCLKAHFMTDSVGRISTARVTTYMAYRVCDRCLQMYYTFYELEINSDRPNVIVCWLRDLGHNLEFYKLAPMVVLDPATKVCFLIGDRVSKPVTSE